MAGTDLLADIDLEWQLPNGGDSKWNPSAMLARCRLHSQAACTQSVFILHLLQEVHKRSRIESSVRKEEHDTGPSLKIGVVGCGRLGTLILRALIANGCTEAGDVTVSTQRPHTLSEFDSQGVHVCFDNHKTCVSCNVLLLCCPPSQLQSVAKDVKGCVHPTTIVLSYLAGVSTARVQKLLSCWHTIHVPFWTAPGEGGSEELLRLNFPRLLPRFSPVQSTKIKETCVWMGCLMAVLVAYCKQECGHLEEALSIVYNLVLGEGCPTIRMQQDQSLEASVSTALEDVYTSWAAHVSTLFCSSVNNHSSLPT